MDAVQVSQKYAQRIRQFLEQHGLWDDTRKLQCFPESKSVIIPVTVDHEVKLQYLISTGIVKCGYQNQNGLSGKIHCAGDQSHGQSHDKHPQTFFLEGIQCTLVEKSLPPSKKSKLKTPHERLTENLRMFVIGRGYSWTEKLSMDIPRHWEVHGDLILLPGSAFTMLPWQQLGESMWKVVAESLGCKRLARKNRIHPDDFRSPSVEMLLGDSSWVEHVDNGVRYCYDILHSMFSSGNITEKLRISTFQCQGETVVDLYAGIGYFTLPYLVHAEAEFVHACEWNPHAVKALERNLNLNGVKHRCQIYFGDNRKVCPKSVADRVNLGLIPSSEEGWPVACAALKPAGGILHIHGNVESYADIQRPHIAEVQGSALKCITEGSDGSKQSCTLDNNYEEGFLGKLNEKNKHWEVWIRHIEYEIGRIMESLHNSKWIVYVCHIEYVKSYAPHVDHLVADVSCRPKGPND